MTTSTIIPTKQNPTFIANCTAFGSINGPYKQTEINNCLCDTFALSYSEAINELHKWIKLNELWIKENPKCKFGIEVVEGGVDSYGDFISKKVYSISATKAKKYLF